MAELVAYGASEPLMAMLQSTAVKRFKSVHDTTRQLVEIFVHGAIDSNLGLLPDTLPPQP